MSNQADTSEFATGARADYRTPCISCGARPTVVLTKNGKDIQKTELCGPCCFGEAACNDPDEWAT